MRMFSGVLAVAAALFVAGACGGSKSTGLLNKDAGTGGSAGTGGAGGSSGCKTSLDCSKSQVCDKTSGQCVDCLTANDCKSGDKCIGNVCRPPCTSDKDCTPLGLLCDTSKGACVQCIQSTDCSGSEFCASGVCKADVCEPGKPTCQGNGIATCNADGSSLGTPVPCGGTKVCVQLKGGPICEEPDAGTGGAGGTGGTAGTGGAGGTSGNGGSAGDAGTVSYASEVLADNPSAYWRLDEKSGTTAADSSGGGHNGTYQGGVSLGAAPLLSGNPGTWACIFDGTSSHIDFQDVFDFAGTVPFSVEFWMKPETIDSGYRRVIAKEQWTVSGAQGENGWNVNLHAASGVSTVSFTRIRDGSGDGVSAPVTAGNVYYVVGTYDGSQMLLYVNGKQVAQAAATHVLLDTTGIVDVGSLLGQQGYYSGTLDEVAIYGHALSAARVQAHYLAGTQ